MVTKQRRGAKPSIKLDSPAPSLKEWCDDFQLPAVHDLLTEKLVGRISKAIAKDLSEWLPEAFKAGSNIWPDSDESGVLQLFISEEVTGKPFMAQYKIEDVLAELSDFYTADREYLRSWVSKLRSIATDIENEIARQDAAGIADSSKAKRS